MISSVGAASSLSYTSAYGHRGEERLPRQGGSSSPQKLDAEAQQQVNKLRAIDQKVREHEQAHLSASGDLGVGGASFQYQRGPDGKNYAVSGEVKIDVSPGRDAKETAEKAKRIQAAALAPSDPSPQDQAVAATAAQLEAQAQAELSRQKRDENTGEGTTTKTNVAEQQIKRILEVYNQPSVDAENPFRAQA